MTRIGEEKMKLKKCASLLISLLDGIKKFTAALLELDWPLN